MSERLVVVSDLHLAGASRLNNFHAGDELVSLVRESTAPGVKLVIGGDGLDLLQLADRPDSLVMADAPSLIRETLKAIKKEAWGSALFDALRGLLEAGGQLIVLPGNHDPELFHPEARRILLEEIEPSANSEALILHASPEPWTTRVGRWEVELGHGHRRDAWNDIAPEALSQSLDTGEPVALPPGSLLVLKVLNVFKDALDPRTGAPRFPFVDLLKPETPAVPLLLLYLDPRMALPALGQALGLTPRMLLQGVRGVLREGPVLTAGKRKEEPPGEGLLARYIAEGFPEAERREPETCVRKLENWLSGVAAPAPGMLAAHGGGRFLLRAFLRAASADGAFFDRTKPDGHDRALIEEHLAPRAGPRVLITGHTHAAREVVLDGDRVYLNTGTWTDLMKQPPLEDDSAVQAFAEALESGAVPRLRHLTYADVTEEGPRLREFMKEE